MRRRMPEEYEYGRLETPPSVKGEPWGRFLFELPMALRLQNPFGTPPMLQVISSGGVDGNPAARGWEHVSVSVVATSARRLPTWDEMCFIKRIFWDDEETVLQFHPMQSAYVNVNPWVLHLWRQNRKNHPLPPRELV